VLWGRAPLDSAGAWGPGRAASRAQHTFLLRLLIFCMAGLLPPRRPAGHPACRCRKLASGVYAVVARYGYMDRIDHGPEFVIQVEQVGGGSSSRLGMLHAKPSWCVPARLACLPGAATSGCLAACLPVPACLLTALCCCLHLRLRLPSLSPSPSLLLPGCWLSGVWLAAGDPGIPQHCNTLGQDVGGGGAAAVSGRSRQHMARHARGSAGGCSEEGSRAGQGLRPW